MTVACTDNQDFAWKPGIPPVGETIAIACRKWSCFHEGVYREVIAGDPRVYLDAMELQVMMQPSMTVIYGSVFDEGGYHKILDERGSPVAAYPNSILAWSYVPDPLQNIQAAVITDMAVRNASHRGGPKSSD